MSTLKSAEELPSSAMIELPAHRAAILNAIKCHKLTLEILEKNCGPEFARFNGHEFLAQLYRAVGNDVAAEISVRDSLGPNTYAVDMLCSSISLLADFWPELIMDHPVIAYVRLLQIFDDLLPAETSASMHKAYGLKGGIR